MGNLTSPQEGEKFFQRITFTQQMNDQNFGQIEIWRSTQLPYEYLMNYKRTFLDKDQNYQDYVKLIKNLQGKTHKNISKLHYLEQKEDNQMCIKNMKVSTFFNYYNFTLAKALIRMRQTNSHFAEKQLWYVLLTLTDIAKFLKSNDISIGDYTLNKIFITPQGFVKLYLIGISDNNRHNSYYQVLCSLQTLQKHLLAPQQLNCLVKGHQSINFNVFSADMFSIGMMILELMTLDDAKFYYNLEQFSVNYDKIKYTFNNLRNVYSKQLLNIVLSCLQINPVKRVDFQTVHNYIQNIRHTIPVSTSIRLNIQQQDKRKAIKTQPSDNRFIKSLNQKLVVIPINVRSQKMSESTSSFKRKSNFALTSSKGFNNKNNY